MSDSNLWLSLGIPIVVVLGLILSAFRPPRTASKPPQILDSAGNRQGQSGASPTSMRSHLPPGILAPRPMSLRQSCSWA